jgi:hypothetical protein
MIATTPAISRSVVVPGLPLTAIGAAASTVVLVSMRAAPPAESLTNSVALTSPERGKTTDGDGPSARTPSEKVQLSKYGP